MYWYIYVLSFYLCGVIIFFKQKTAYEVRISDWSSDVSSSDLMRWMWNVPVLKVRLHPVVTVHANGLVKEVLLIGPRVLDVVEVGQRPLIRPDGSLGPILVLEDRDRKSTRLNSSH